MMNKKYEVSGSIHVQPKNAAFEHNRRILIQVEINPNEKEKAVVIGINPSIACDNHSDTTLTKISRYLYQYGIGTISMVNLFETVSTDPKGIDHQQETGLKKHKELFEQADIIVIAWGTGKKWLTQKETALKFLEQYSSKLYCIRGKNGTYPRHPSRIGYSEELVAWKEAMTK